MSQFDQLFLSVNAQSNMLHLIFIYACLESEQCSVTVLYCAVTSKYKYIKTVIVNDSNIFNDRLKFSLKIMKRLMLPGAHSPYGCM